MGADRGDQDGDICSLTQGENGSWQQKQRNIRQLFNATHSLMTTSMDKHVFIVKEMKMRDCALKKTLKELYVSIRLIRDYRKKTLL